MFDVDIWGNVAAWVGAIGTGGAAIAAASYYILSARSRKRAQARQVHVEVTFPEPGKVRGFKFVLYNDSEHPISGFYLGRCKERRLIPTLLNGRTFQKVCDGEVEQAGIGTVLVNPKSELVGFDGRRSDFGLTIEGASAARHLRSGRSNMPTVLPAAESVALKPSPNHRFRWSTVYWIGFLDANGNRWEREVTNNITTYGRLRKGKRGYFEIRAKRRRRRLKHYWDVTRWVWRNRGLQTYSQREPPDNVAAGTPQT